MQVSEDPSNPALLAHLCLTKESTVLARDNSASVPTNVVIFVVFAWDSPSLRLRMNVSRRICNSTACSSPVALSCRLALRLPGGDHLRIITFSTLDASCKQCLT